MWLYIGVGTVCLFGAYLWFGHVRFRQYGRDVLHVADVALAEADETQQTRQRFLNSAEFAGFVHKGLALYLASMRRKQRCRILMQTPSDSEAEPKSPLRF
jgi:hypothetical protein